MFVFLQEKTMKRLVEFATEENEYIIVEVEEPEIGGLVRAARPGEIITKASQSFEESLEKVKPAANAIIMKLRSLHDQPDEIKVEFGLKLSADAGAVVASAGVEANYTVTLKWKKLENTQKTAS